jgi:hypothetical protein
MEQTDLQDQVDLQVHKVIQVGVFQCKDK